MGKFLTEEEIRQLEVLLSLYLSLPFSEDLTGEVFENILAKARGGIWSGKRDNRPRPDIILGGKNYVVKTEKVTEQRIHPKDILGKRLDIITARIDPAERLKSGQELASLSDNELGKLILQHYNESRVKAYVWDVIAILFRFQNNTEFVYFEEPAIEYPPNDFTWKSTGRARRGNRNIAGYDKQGRQKFRWTSAGLQFYVVHDIPRDADLLTIKIERMTVEDLVNLLGKKPSL